MASATFCIATQGVSFGYDPATGTFGGLSVVGENGAFVAAANGDIGSPGTIISPPQVADVSFSQGAGFSLSFATLTNLNYSVEYKDDLTNANWTTLTNFTATSGSFTFTDPAAGTNTARFYRVTVRP